jgi:hypothetical protein
MKVLKRQVTTALCRPPACQPETHSSPKLRQSPGPRRGAGGGPRLEGDLSPLSSHESHARVSQGPELVTPSCYRRAVPSQPPLALTPGRPSPGLLPGAGSRGELMTAEVVRRP